jgi:serine/threonine protein kinase
MELHAVDAIARNNPPHPHVIQVYDFWVVDEATRKTYIQMELCDGNLQDYLNERKQSNLDIEAVELCEIMIAILNGLQVCHKHRLLHRDLKLLNGTSPLLSRLNAVLYINEKCPCHFRHSGKRWLLTDFGFSTAINDDSMAFSKEGRGTSTYCPPELLNVAFDSNTNEATLSKKSDIWAIGCVLYQLATTNKAKAFPNDTYTWCYGKGFDGFSLPQLTLEQNPQLKRSSQMSAGAANGELEFWRQLNVVLTACFSRRPTDRPSVLQLLGMFEIMRTEQLQAAKPVPMGLGVFRLFRF